MPELPEVETIVRDLRRKIRGRRIVGVWTDWPKMIKRPPLKDFERQTKGARIKEIRRRGKNILIELSYPPPWRDRPPTAILLIHQKMTGHLLVGRWRIKKEKKGIRVESLIQGPLQEKVNDYIHLIFYLDNGEMLALSDLRKFAKVLFGRVEEVENLKEIKALGPDPLDPKTRFTDFRRGITRRQRAIKQVLMDQTVVSGIGNIYADDILWLAKIHPQKPANQLTGGELKSLWLAAKRVLKTAIKLRGTSVADFRDTAGRPGRYGGVRLAYQRTGSPCRRCATPIKRLKLGGRSAHFCPTCQQL
jgi:formamidopyrimidine-DNA glycosylase